MAAVFAILWATNYRYLDSTGLFKNFWQGHFPPLPGQAGFFGWYSDDLPNTLGWLFGQTQWLLLIFFIVLGLSRAWGINRRLWALTLPIVLSFAAGLLKLYPIYDRLILFWTVLLTPFLALGAFYTWELFHKQHRRMTAVFALFVVIPFLHPLLGLIHTQDFQQLKQVSVAIAARAKPGDVVYLHNRPAPLYQYYFKRYPLAKGVQLVPGEKADLTHLPGLLESRYHGKHVYFLYTEPWCSPDEIGVLASEMRETRQIKGVLEMNLAGAFELQMK